MLDLAVITWDEAFAALRAALAGTAPALLPLPPGEPGMALARAAGTASPQVGTALLLPTSGSAGSPKLVELGAAALSASASATHARLGGPGRWLLALPLTHVAGWQVVVRSLVAGTQPAVLHDSPGAAPFTAELFTRGAVSSGARYTALVPAQLGRLLDDRAATAALARFDAVLLGGAATPQALHRRAVDAGVRVVRTYGMTETCGGCVYDGVPLEGVGVRTAADGRVLISGPVLATGYLGDDGYRYDDGYLGDDGYGGDDVDIWVQDRDGRRWFRTSDHGTLDADGRLHVDGRLDDQIVTGGVNLVPGDVEDVLAGLPGVRGVVVVGVPDADWGQAVVAVVSGRDMDLPTLAAVRAAVADRLGAPAAPRRLVVVDAVPLRGIGKPDRAAAQQLAAGP